VKLKQDIPLVTLLIADNIPPVIVILGESDSEDDQYTSDEELDFTSSDNNIKIINESGPSCR
jgi:hypothetical protein